MIRTDHDCSDTRGLCSCVGYGFSSLRIPRWVGNSQTLWRELGMTDARLEPPSQSWFYLYLGLACSARRSLCHDALKFEHDPASPPWPGHLKLQLWRRQVPCLQFMGWNFKLEGCMRASREFCTGWGRVPRARARSGWILMTHYIVQGVLCVPLSGEQEKN